MGDLIAVRAITAFIVLDADQATWNAVLDAAVGFTAGLSTQIKAAGYRVQSLRPVPLL